jgi:uncharacterized OsmC-like protein
VCASRTCVEIENGLLAAGVIGGTNGVHGAIAAHHNPSNGALTPYASTLDNIVGATAGCLMGTQNGALFVRQIPTQRRLRGEAVGEIEVEDGVLVRRRIRNTARFRGSADLHETVECAAAISSPLCPVCRSLQKAIAISTELEYEIGLAEQGCPFGRDRGSRSMSDSRESMRQLRLSWRSVRNLGPVIHVSK